MIRRCTSIPFRKLQHSNGQSRRLNINTTNPCCDYTFEGLKTVLIGDKVSLTVMAETGLQSGATLESGVYMYWTITRSRRDALKATF